MHLPFQQMSTFCGVGTDPTDRPFAVIGAPVDCATTFRSGTRMGPAAIRQVSLMLTDGTHERYPHDLRDWAYDAGNMPLPTGNTVDMLATVKSCMDRLHDRHVVTLGGDHGITYGVLESLAARHKGKEMAVVHFDAHCDTWTDHFGQPYGHGTWMYNAIEQNLIDPHHTISIGIRSPADEVSRAYLSANGGTTVTARQAMRIGPALMATAIRDKVGDRPCYLSLDIDCLDPAYAPGTGTPEIGGLTSMWVSQVLEELRDVNWIGMDCVEVSPAYDHGDITSLAAATFCWQYLSMNIDKLAK